MKRILLASALVGCIMSASAQDIIERPTFGDNWQIGLDGGITTPLKGHSFFGNIRPNVGLHIGKQLTPLFGLGVEGIAGINTSSVNGGRHSKTAFDNTYVGAYGTFNLTNAFCGFRCEPRAFTVDALVGIGWLHDYVSYGSDHSNIGAKAGLNFNFAVTDHFGISLKPSVLWNVTGNGTGHHDQGLDLKRANFNLTVGLNYNFGPGFQCVTCPPDNSYEVAELNGRVHEPRAYVAGGAPAPPAADADPRRAIFQTLPSHILGMRPDMEGAAASEAMKPYHDAVELLLQIRAEVKQKKDWATSDLIRDRLAAIGFAVKDTRDGGFVGAGK